jgi:type IV secretion system protein VirD4
MDAFSAYYRFGSAAFAAELDLVRSGLLRAPGPLLGFMRNAPLRVNGDAPIVTFGGAGSGKLRDTLAYNVCGMRFPDGTWKAPPRVLVNDPRGELAAISIQNQVRFNRPAYCINPFGLHGLPMHRVNPWDIIEPNSPTFHADVKLVTSDLIPLSGSASGQYFELRAREWTEALVKHHAATQGSITLPILYDIINAIEDPSAWADIGEAMVVSPFGDVRRVALEMNGKRLDAPKEYGAIMGEIFKSVSFLSDPAIRETLSGSDFSLEVLCQQDSIVYNMVPAEYAGLLAPMQRAIIGAAMLYKQRHPGAPRILFLIDEAAQLGRFDALLRAYTYGRGMGIRAWSVWQDCGQIARNYGHDALSGFIGSSQTRQFFGTRDLETASMVSRMLGTQTLEYDAVLEQAEARRNKAHIVRELIAGADPFEAGLNFAHHARAAITRTKQARALMTPDEILNMPEDRQLLFVSGLGLHPVYAEKYPYFSRPEMAGAYLPNPYHPPGDAVQIATRRGQRWARVITERVPSHLTHLPQYESGSWSFIEGHRPQGEQA